MRQTLLFLILGLSALLAVLHFYAMDHNLYYSVSWADTVTHTLAGAMVAGIAIYGFGLFKKNKDTAGLASVLAFTFIVGVAWEILEATTGMVNPLGSGYPLDTLGDLFFDVFGGYLMHLFISSINAK